MQNNPPSTREELLARNELLNLAIEVAFQEKLLTFLTDPNTDPAVLEKYLKMHEKRETMKLKAFAAKIKEREVELKEKTAERRLALEERKQTLNEKKLNGAEERPSKEPAPAPNKPLVAPQNSHPMNPRQTVQNTGATGVLPR